MFFTRSKDIILINFINFSLFCSRVVIRRGRWCPKEHRVAFIVVGNAVNEFLAPENLGKDAGIRLEMP